jgi:hypothetical protein
MTTEEPAPRCLYPDENDPGALRVELSLQGVSARGVALIVTDAPPSGDDERERPVRIVISADQAATLARRLLAVIDEL